MSLDEWLGNDLVRYAVLQRLTVIGEAARRLSPETQRLAANVPWRLMGDFRNLAVHNYFSVEWPLVWSMAHGDVPRLLEQVRAMLAQHYPAVLAVVDDGSGENARSSVTGLPVTRVGSGVTSEDVRTLDDPDA